VPSPRRLPSTLGITVSRVRSAAVLLSLLGACFGVTAQPRAIVVESVEVRLFLSHSGSFSEPISEGATLWNTVIGEGGLVEPSSSTFVKVQLSSEPKSYSKGAKVGLRVLSSAAKPRTVNLSKSLGVFGADGKQYVAFWLPDTGCAELQLEARVTGAATPVKQTIPFRCGE
jgi:hypothetical protein